MTDEINRHDLAERVKLIEDMLAEGRRTTSRWGWTFVLWGIAYYIAIFWSNVASPSVAWPVCMIVTSIITAFGGRFMNRGTPRNAKSSALMSIWTAVGIALFLFAFGASMSPHRSEAIILGGVEILLGTANIASGLTLRWKTQLTAGLLWMAAGTSSFFVGEKVMGILFLVAIFLCQIVFGVYLMLHESIERKREVAHA